MPRNRGSIYPLLTLGIVGLIAVATLIASRFAGQSRTEQALTQDNTFETRSEAATAQLNCNTHSLFNQNAWTDVPIAIGQETPIVYPTEGNGQYSFVRVALVSKKANADLPGGTIPLATVTFQEISNTPGTALIKFPDDSSVLHVVGSGI